MNRHIERYFSADSPGTQGAGTAGTTTLTDSQQDDDSADAVDDWNEAGQGADWKEGDDWDNFGDEEVSDNISETGKS